MIDASNSHFETLGLQYKGDIRGHFFQEKQQPGRLHKTPYNVGWYINHAKRETQRDWGERERGGREWGERKPIKL